MGRSCARTPRPVGGAASTTGGNRRRGILYLSVRLAVRRKSRGRLIRRFYEVDPLLCRCGGQMRIVGFITRTTETTGYGAGSVMSVVDSATETRRPDRGNFPPG